MPDTRPTYEIAAEHIAPYVQPLWPGALAMPFEHRDEQDRTFSLSDDAVAGRFVVLVLVNEPDSAAAQPVLEAFARAADAFEQRQLHLVAICANCDALANRALRRRSGFPGPIVGDSTGAIFASYGVHKGSDRQTRIVVLTPYRQVRVWFDSPFDVEQTLGEVMTIVDNSSSASSTGDWAPPHAPVLVVPQVLSPQECGQLIESCETGSPFMVRRPRQGEVAGNYRIPVYEHNRQDRVDIMVKDQRLQSFLDERIWGRIAPMIKKAFAFEITRREDLHVARYVGERSGNRIGHRDNVSAANAHRRFALSMSLNDDYEGGEIVFREFSPQGYRPPPGAALIFSSSLLHEVMETTRGIRYNLISHLFNDQSVRPR
jgi:predicted 2-oxoglutarate/Fe(II)-dependent dioxygenase YbiX/peroxiredoxin